MRKSVAVIAALACVLFGARAFALDLIKDGKAVSAIVIPDKATPVEQRAAQTLVKYLKMSSGAVLPVVAESAKPADAVLVSVGKTEMAGKAGITDEGLKYDGYRLLVKGGTLYLLGRDTALISGAGAQGSVRAAFGFLERLDFRWLQPTPMGAYAPQMKTVSAPDDLNVTYEPPLMFMHGAFTNGSDWSLANGFRTAVKMYVGDSEWVSAVPATLFKDHPEYFVMRNGKRIKPADPGNPQYCMSNPDARRLMAEWVMKRFDEGFDIVAVGQSDAFQPCQCPLCANLSASDQVHDALRAVAEMTLAKYPDKKLHLLIYNPNNPPPGDFKNYPPNCIGQCCLTEMFQTAFGTHDKGLDYWRGALAGGITVYSYYMGTYYDNALSPRFYPELAAEKIRDWIAHGVQGIYWCGGGENWGAEGPTYYMIGRMAADPARDPKKVYEEYLNLSFGKAAPAMKEYYDTLYERLGRFRYHKDDWVVAGIGTPNDTFAAVYSAEVLLKLRGSLATARKQAAGDDRALGWIRLAEISFNQYSLIATAFHFYEAYQLNPTDGNYQQVSDAVKAWQAWADETSQIGKTDNAFAENFFPNRGLWSGGNLKSNCGQLGCRPFVGNFAKNPSAAAPKAELSLTGWKLQFSDDFKRADLGKDWQVVSGDWEVANGALVAHSDDECQIVCTRTFPGSVRLEYDASTETPGDLSGLLGIAEGGYQSGYFFGFGSNDNQKSKLLVQGAEIEAYEGEVVAGKVHHVLCQRDGDVLAHVVDGKTLMTYRDPQPLKGEGHQMIGFYLWKTGRISNVKVYTKAE